MSTSLYDLSVGSFLQMAEATVGNHAGWSTILRRQQHQPR